MGADPANLLSERYAIEREFTGAMGRLFIVREKEGGERLAAKTVRADLGSDIVFTRFQIEARAWIALGRHPHVVEARFYRELDGHPFLFMEYVEGLDLQRLLGATGALPLAQAAELGRHLLAGLVHAHATRVKAGTEGLVHRDLKPANLLLRRDRTLKITDWGLVKVLGGTRHTADGQMLGTLTYCAPEQLRDAGEVDARADLFAVGAILFEMIAGRPPFPGDEVGQVIRALLMDTPPRLSSFVPGCPRSLSDLVADLLAKEPDERPASAAEVLARLEQIPIAPSGSACPGCGLLTSAALAACPLCTAGTGHTAAPTRAATPAPSDDDLALRMKRTVSTEGMLEVPAGPFLFGPERATRTLGAYWIDRLPVTNRQFEVFLRETSYRPEDARDFLKHWRAGHAPTALLDHPVVWVNLADAEAYAAWAGKRLPTWEQWERAARGTDGRTYPWGETFDTRRTNTKEGGAGGTSPVERHGGGASPIGCLDMAGNVFQWTSTWREPDLRRTKVVCGGSWASPLAPQGLSRVRNLFPAMRDFQTGLRCALDLGA